MAKIHLVDNVQKVEWEELTPKEVILAEKALDAIMMKNFVSFHYKNGDKDVIVRMTGEFLLNGSNEVFDDLEDVIFWIEPAIKKTVRISASGRYNYRKTLEVKKDA